MRHPMRTLLGMGIVGAITLGMATPAQAIPADNPVIGPFLPPALQRYVAFDNMSKTYTNPEKGKVSHKLLRSGFYNSSPLFGVDRNADITIEVKNRISYRKFDKAYYYAGVQFGCQLGIGNTSLKVYANSGTKLTVNGQVSATGNTEPVTEFIQQTILTACEISVEAGKAGGTDGATTPQLVKTAIEDGLKSTSTTWNLQDTISTASKFKAGIKATPNTKPDFKQTYQMGKLTEIPFFILKYSPGVNQVRLSGLSLRVEGCVGIAKLRPFIRTLGKTKSGNYVDYSTFGEDYLFIPNKFFRMDT